MLWTKVNNLLLLTILENKEGKSSGTNHYGVSSDQLKKRNIILFGLAGGCVAILSAVVFYLRNGKGIEITPPSVSGIIRSEKEQKCDELGKKMLNTLEYATRMTKEDSMAPMEFYYFANKIGEELTQIGIEVGQVPCNTNESNNASDSIRYKVGIAREEYLSAVKEKDPDFYYAMKSAMGESGE